MSEKPPASADTADATKQSQTNAGHTPSVSPDLRGRTLLMSGGSRGIGLAIARAAARCGADIVLLAKTDTPDPRLPGTIHTAVAELRELGAGAVGIVGDVRESADVVRAVEAAVTEFGGIDIVVNNASAISTGSSLEVSDKRFALMHDVNVRGTWLLTTKALPTLLQAPDPRVLTLSPPLNLAPAWLGAHPAYTASKYGMTLLTLGWAEEFAGSGLGATCLWPQTAIDTAATRNVGGMGGGFRSPEIMADAALAVLSRPCAEVSGRTLLDVDALAMVGRTNLERYGTGEFYPDLFLGEGPK